MLVIDYSIGSGLNETVDDVVDSAGFGGEGAVVVEVDLTVGDFVKAFVALEEAVRVEVDLTVDDSPGAVFVGSETGVVRGDFALLGVSIPVLAAAFEQPLLDYSKKGAAAAAVRIAKRIQGEPVPITIR